MRAPLQMDEGSCKVQRYAADGWGFLHTYASMTAAISDPILTGAAAADVLRAVKGAYAFRGFRWALLDPRHPDNSMQYIGPTRQSDGSLVTQHPSHLRKGYSEVYVLGSPSGMFYAGKADCYVLRDGVDTRWGTWERWEAHIRDARASSSRCRLLNAEIRHHGPDAMLVSPLCVCKEGPTAVMLEKHMMSEYQTLHPSGLNIQPGGRADKPTAETRERMSAAQREHHRHHPRRHTDETKKRIANKVLDGVQRRGHNGQVLPRHVKYVNWADRRGYQVLGHPLCKSRYFVSTEADVDLDRKYTECTTFLTSLADRTVAT